ncbi:MAG: MATE family efflux transporter [Eubacterium sp.]|nr:MATE family efflux transporter [Eubacterium sp.]
MFDSAQLRQLIYPLIIEQVLAITVGMVDTIMISYAGEAAMSGVSLVDMINNLLISIFAAIATGGAVVISQYLGSRDKDNASRAASQLVTVATVIAVGFMILSVLGNRFILTLLFGSIEADVMESASIYFLISAWSYPFLAVFNACAAIYRSMGNAKISMQISAGMNLFNAVGNAILIFGFSMGAAGAALSTFAARVLGAITILVLATGSANEVRVKYRELLRWEKGMVKRILHIAIPSGVENGLFQLGRVLVVSIIALFGTAQIAANAVANTLDSMGCIAGQAMNLAMITVVGQCMGAGDKEQAVYYTKRLWKLTYMITMVVNAIILLGLPLILKCFSLSPEAYRYAYILVMIHDGMAIFLWPTAFTMPNALRAAGDVKFCMFISIFSMVVFRILFSVILGIGLGWGAIGVWVAMVFDWIFRSSLFVWRFVQGKWLEYKVI